MLNEQKGPQTAVPDEGFVFRFWDPQAGGWNIIRSRKTDPVKALRDIRKQCDRIMARKQRSLNRRGLHRLWPKSVTDLWPASRLRQEHVR